MVRGALVSVVALLVIAAPAGAQAPQPYDGSNPFECTIQSVGYGVDFPDPDADPFCVEFDKRRQNVAEGGIADFLAQEPARVAAASPKCFYYQHDHWTSSVVQGDGATELYNWDGSYYFDKARGTGGVYVENFTFNNQTGDPRMVPGFPEDWKPFFGPGRGGFQAVQSGVVADPSCVALAASKSVYRKTAGGAAAGGGAGCLTGQGSIGRGIPGARLGSSQGRVLGALGQPTRFRRGFMRWCTAGDGELVAGFARRGRRPAKLRLVLSTAPAFDLGGIAAGDRSAVARRRLRGERRLRRGLLVVRGRRAQRLVRLRRGRVQWVGSAGPRLSKRRVLRLLAGSRRATS